VNFPSFDQIVSPKMSDIKDDMDPIQAMHTHGAMPDDGNDALFALPILGLVLRPIQRVQMRQLMNHACSSNLTPTAAMIAFQIAVRFGRLYFIASATLRQN
jgi:hypothetical protein